MSLPGYVKSQQRVFLVPLDLPDQRIGQDIIAEGGCVPQPAQLDLGADVADGNGLGAVQMVFPETTRDQFQQGAVLPVADQRKRGKVAQGQGIP